MTGKDIFQAVTDAVSAAGKPAARLRHEWLMGLINSTMREMWLKAAVRVGRYTMTTETNKYFVVPYQGSVTEPNPGEMLWIQRILRASYNGVPLTIEKPLQFPGVQDSLGDVPRKDEPENIWLEYDDVHGEQLIGYYPMSDADYTVHLRIQTPLPKYLNANNQLPIRVVAHPVLEAGVMALVFSGSADFHDNQLKAYHLARFNNGVNELQAYTDFLRRAKTDPANDEVWFDTNDT